MRAIVGLLGGVLIVLMLAEFFVAFLLPRRVKRDPRIARGTVEVIWKPWRAIARRLPPIPADAMLGYFGPLAFLLELAVWVLGLVVGYACLQWAGGGRFSLDSSAGTFLAATFDHTGSWHRAVGFVETATAVGVLFTVIGYLPAVYSAYSLREIAISRLSTRAGAPARAARQPELALGADGDRRHLCGDPRRRRRGRVRAAQGRSRVPRGPARARRPRASARRRPQRPRPRDLRRRR